MTAPGLERFRQFILRFCGVRDDDIVPLLWGDVDLQPICFKTSLRGILSWRISSVTQKRQQNSVSKSIYLVLGLSWISLQEWLGLEGYRHLVEGFQILRLSNFDTLLPITPSSLMMREGAERIHVEMHLRYPIHTEVVARSKPLRTHRIAAIRP